MNAPIAILKITERDGCKNGYMLTVNESRRVTLQGLNGGCGFDLSYIAHGNATQFGLALAACDTQDEALIVCDKMLPRYKSGEHVGKSFHIVEPWNPRAVLDMAHEDKRQQAEQFGVEHRQQHEIEDKPSRGKPWRIPNVHVLYMSDGEQTTFLPLADLISNFDANGGWHDRCNAEDMRDEIFGRGWYEGTHECGRYLVVAVDKIKEASNLSHYFLT